MSYPRISDEDWDVVKKYAGQITNYSMDDNIIDGNIARENMNEYLLELDQKYGPHPIIYDTIADYLPKEEDELPWRLKAYEVCNEFDYFQMAFITISISRYFAEDAPDIEKAKFWIEIALKNSIASEDEDLIEDSKCLKEDINRMINPLQ